MPKSRSRILQKDKELKKFLREALETCRFLKMLILSNPIVSIIKGCKFEKILICLVANQEFGLELIINRSKFEKILICSVANQEFGLELINL
jgi:hypothetical protein